MSTRARNATALSIGALLMATGLVLAARSRPHSPPIAPLDAIPSDASIVLTLNVPHLQSSPLAKRVLGDNSTQSFSSSVVRICGFDPLSRVQEIGAWWGPDQSLGFVATGPLNASELIDCAQKVIRDRKGTAQVTQQQGFSVVRDESLGAQSAQIAIRSAGPSLLGSPKALAQMLSALQQPSDNPHHKLREHALPNADLSVSMIVSEELRGQIRTLAGQSTSLLTGVVALAGSAQLGVQGQFQMQIFCESPEHSRLLSQWLFQQREAALRSTPMRLAGIASILEGTRIEEKGSQLTIRASAATQEVALIIERIEKWANDAENSAPGPTKKLPLPDEVLRP